MMALHGYAGKRSLKPLGWNGVGKFHAPVVQRTESRRHHGIGRRHWNGNENHIGSPTRLLRWREYGDRISGFDVKKIRHTSLCVPRDSTQSVRS